MSSPTQKPRANTDAAEARASQSPDQTDTTAAKDDTQVVLSTTALLDEFTVTVDGEPYTVTPAGLTVPTAVGELIKTAAKANRVTLRSRAA